MQTLEEFVGEGGLFVLTGAGMSTESGIPDYRRPDGTRRTVPMTFQQFMASTEARQRYWARSAVGWETFAQARPNAGHRAVTELQRRGRFTHVVTQNVDGLHQEAGTVGVTELHGSLARVVCVACRAHRDRTDYQLELREANPWLPRQATLLADGDAEVSRSLESETRLVPCRQCGSDTVKPDVVMFGESVAPEIVRDQFSQLERSRAVLVLGSSLKVMSGYRFVLAAHKAGLPVALVGRGEMRGQERADLVVHDGLGEVLTGLVGDLPTVSTT